MRQGFKKVPIYELRKSGVTVRETGRIFHELFDLISDCGRGSSDYRHISESEALILLIEKYGKYYGSIKDKYVHYALPHEYSWQDSWILRSVLAQIRKVARGPLEWRGSPFSQAEIYRSLTRDGDEAPRRVRRSWMAVRRFAITRTGRVDPAPIRINCRSISGRGSPVVAAGERYSALSLVGAAATFAPGARRK